MNSIKIFLPVFPKEKHALLKGYITRKDNSIDIYITKVYFDFPSFQANGCEENNIFYGYYYANNSDKTKYTWNDDFFVIENMAGSFGVKKCIINGVSINLCDQIVLLLYDYDTVNSSEAVFTSEDFMSSLKHYVRKDSSASENTSKYYELCHCPSWLAASMFAKHIFNSINLVFWLVTSVKRKNKISIQRGNLILALLVDVFLGYLILELIMFDKKEIATILFGALEKLVNLLYSLLKWLMGAPAGLKLNNAFNKMLGKYFLYHVELWWLFLEVSSSKLDTILYIYQYVGFLGFTFQAAIVSDMLCLVTFHSYCIYVYAARLFNIQVSGLTALLRLFVGRKYNPLRNVIDSCEYTNQELFVGTVAFTILLLLLPTTLMYYIVFTMFRVLSLLVQYILAGLIFIMQCTPFYVLILWLARSPKIAGKVFIEEVTPLDSATLTLNVKLLNQSIGHLFVSFKPPIDMIKNVEWKVILKNVFTGKPII
ncbi:phosphatidylinositol N-acetylglucosaminyltransferase subunit Q [Aricia agestis]|uniref:phosphatidylinositol N-acetylglucosaminyltransferase subunit Q n=1 Tax=Aricia agestis TaxID=91739 RepID=UPI001C204C4B|nr:phosphatidylinositol N-acetylglucosaminyltransferase subunit Q [Aricia agestis]